METKSNIETTRTKITGIIKKAIPFIAVMVIILLIIFPLSKKIASKKIMLAQKHAKESAVTRALTNVVTMELTPCLIMDKISLPGIAKSWISLEVVSEIKGKIINKTAIEGRRVNKGDTLAVIDKGDYQNAYDSALASYETAKITEKRLKTLAKKQFVTESQLDDAVVRVKTSKADLENAKLNLSRCTIRSPMQGIVDRIYIENGKFLNSGDPVVKILQIDKLKIEVGIPESDVDAIRKLESFDITIDALKGKTYTGKYHYLYKTAGAMARLYNLEIKVDNTELLILPDMFARVTIIKQKEPYGLAVPMYSLVSLNKDVGVYVENNGIVRFKHVKTGFQDGWKIQISEGLAPGEKVVVVGHRIIEDGEQVNVTKTIRDMDKIL